MEDELMEDSSSATGVRRMTPVDFVVQSDPSRKVVLRKIQELEEEEEEEAGAEAGGSEATPEEVEAALEKICALHDLLESDGQATGRATNILKELGTAMS
jgi:hypothetical protein